jgi:hypothetical protein
VALRKNKPGKNEFHYHTGRGTNAKCVQGTVLYVAKKTKKKKKKYMSISTIAIPERLQQMSKEALIKTSCVQFLAEIICVQKNNTGNPQKPWLFQVYHTFYKFT